MQLRNLTQDDAEAFRQLRLEALRLCPAAFSADYETSAQQSPADFATRMRNAPDQFIVGAFRGAVLVGCGGFYRSEGLKLRHTGNIWGMYVAPSARGAGIGRGVLTEIVAQVRALTDIERVRICVIAGNAAARNLYLTSGFEIFGREPHALRIGDTYYDEEHMALFLRK